MPRRGPCGTPRTYCLPARENTRNRGPSALSPLGPGAPSPEPPFVQVRVDFDPGAVSVKHNHPGEEIAYVLEGTLEYQLEGRPPVTLHAGQALFIPDGVAHVAKNVGGGKASELATYIVKKGEPIFVPVK
ncbi:cupin domain-containing protein [Sinorhizobium meliloti]|nr:cupin domain-containing protein [Sinorhizobium meliloti]